MFEGVATPYPARSLRLNRKDDTPNRPSGRSPTFIEVIDVPEDQKSPMSPPRPADQKGVAVKFGGRG